MIKSPQADLPRGLSGASDLWDQPQASVILLADYMASGAPAVDQGLTAPQLASQAAFFAPTVTRGAVSLSAPILQGSQAFYAPSVSAGAYALTQSARLDSTTTLYAGSVTAGAAALSAARITNASSLFAPVVSPGAVAVQAPRIEGSSAIYQATISVEAASLVAPLLANINSIYPSRVDLNVVAPSLAGGAQFFQPTISAGAVALGASLLDSQGALFAPTVAKELHLVSLSQARLLYQVYLLHGLDVDLMVGQGFRRAGEVEQEISESGGKVTITTTGSPALPRVDVGVMIEELAALHGLTAPLEVTDAGRQAGVIVQSFAQSGGVTTVSRA